MTWPRPVRAAITAVQFLTRIPLRGGVDGPDDDRSLLVDAVGCFPVVGSLIGLITGVVAVGAAGVWGASIGVGLALAVEAIVTGAFHEDAVADTCDAFGGGWTREQTLKILKDSRVGSYGALGLILAVGLRWACLASIDVEVIVAAAVVAGTVGRLMIVVAMTLVPPVPNRDGLSKDVGERAGAKQLTVAGLTAIPGLVLPLWLINGTSVAVVVTGLIAALIVTGVFCYYVRHRLGGMVGDCLGTVCVLSRLAALLAWTAKLS